MYNKNDIFSGYSLVKIFEFENYRLILKQSLLDRKNQFGKAYTFEKMAKHCRIQRTYLSTALNGNGHLNSDQVFMSCEFLKFNEDETRYTGLLHERERSAFTSRRGVLSNEIAEIRNRYLQTDAHIDSNILTSTTLQVASEFYLDFNSQLVHMFLTVEKYRRNVSKLQKALRFDSEVLSHSLNLLERAGLITINEGRIDVLQDNSHLPKSSPLYNTYITQMRMRGLERMQTQLKENSYSFSVLFSASESARLKIQRLFLRFINEAQNACQEGPTESVFQMNFDLLKWDS